MFRIKNIFSLVVISLFFLFMICSCAPKSNMGMIRDSGTGIQYGSIIERSFFIDSSELENNKIKVSARNVSGDSFYDISNFKSSLINAFIRKGFDVAGDKDFGMKFDVVIEYSGHVQENMSLKYGFLGGAAGGVAGYKANTRGSEAVGILAGATLGAILGSYVVDDTYIIMAKVNIGIVDDMGKNRKTIVFSSSPEMQEEANNKRTFYQEIKSTKIAVFAGGRNMDQSKIVQGVKQRLLNILSDII